MAWDPLGANCMVTAYVCGITVMWDVETSSQLSTFQKQPLGIRGMGWLPWAPGSFMTVNNSNCVHLQDAVAPKTTLDDPRELPSLPQNKWQIIVSNGSTKYLPSS